MKEKFLKVTAMWQVVVMLLAVVISLFTVVQTTSIAQVDYDALDKIVMAYTRVNITKHVYSDVFGTHKDDPKYGIYISKTQYNNNVGVPDSTNTEYSNKWNSIQLDTGVQFYIVPIEWYEKRQKNNQKKVSDFDYKWTIYANNEVVKSGTGLEAYSFNYSDVQARISYPEGIANYHVEIYKNGKREIGEDIYIGVRKPYIISNTGNAYIEKQKSMDKLYVKPDVKIQLTNSFKNGTPRGNGTYTIESSNKNGFSLSENTLQTPALLGKSVNVKFVNKYGSITYVEAITSNFVDECNEMSAGNSKTNIQNISEIYKPKDTAYYITKKATTGIGEIGNIKIKAKSKFNGMKAAVTGFWASKFDGDVTGVKGNIKSNQSGEQWYEISFKTPSMGIIKFSYVDYENKSHEIYIKVEAVNKDTIVIEDPQTDEPEQGEDDIPEQKQPENQEPGNQQGGNQGGQQGDQKEETIVAPTITISENQKSATTVEFNVSIKDNTYAKYYFEKRDSKGVIQKAGTLNSKSYNANKGDGVNEVHNFKVILSTLGNNKVEPGAYDLVVVAANKYDDHCSWKRSLTYWVNEPPVPIINSIQTGPEEAAKGIKSYVITATDPDGKTEDLGIWYYVVKKKTPTKIETPTKDVIKSQGFKLTEKNKIIKFGTNSDEYNEAGYYDIFVYAEDKLGFSRITSLKNILVNNSPKITYHILSENGTSAEGYTYSNTENNKKTVRVTVTDPDGDAIHGWYIASDADPTEDGKVKTNEMQEKISKQLRGIGKNPTEFNVNESSKSFDIELDSSNGADEQYIYVIAGDKWGAETYFVSGIIIVDCSDLELRNIYIQDIMNKETEFGDQIDEKIYGVGDTINVVCEFNHKLMEQAPDLELKIGNTTRKQDSIGYKDNTVIYTYKITENDPNGKVELSQFDYSNNVFKDTYSNQGQFNKQIAESTKTNEFISTKQIFVDTISPKVTNIEIAYTADDTVIMDGITYIKDLTGVTCKLTYSEPIIGKKTVLGVQKGSKYTFWHEGKCEENIERITEEFDLLASKRDKSGEAFEGNYEITRYNNLVEDIVDKAENPAKADNTTTYTYTLNGETIEKAEVCIDKAVYEGIIAIENTQINSDTIVNYGSKITCFAEYKNGVEQDYKDLSGVKSIQLKVYSNSERPIVLKDKTGSEIARTGIMESDQQGFTSILSYDLNEEDLPASFYPENGYDYNIVTIKEDELGNIAEKSVKISVSDLVKLNKEKSLLKVIEQEGPSYHNLLELEDKTHYLYFKINDANYVEALKVEVIGANDTAIPVESLGATTLDGEEYYKYSFQANKAGKYKINVSLENENGQEVALLNEEFSAPKLFVPCDIDCDGTIGPMDLTYLLRFLAGIDNDFLTYRSGDVDHDGDVTIADAVALANIIAGTGRYQRQGNGYVTGVE